VLRLARLVAAIVVVLAVSTVCLKLFLQPLPVTKIASAGAFDSDACLGEQADGSLDAGYRAYSLAWEHSNSQRRREALACFRVSVALLTPRLGAFDTAVVNSTVGVAMSLNEIERSWDAEELLKSRLALGPPTAKTWRGHVDLLHYLGYIVGGQRRLRDQEAAYLQALELTRSFAGSEHADAAQSLDRLADLYRGRDPEKFRSFMTESLAIQERNGVPNLNQYIHRLMALADSYASTSDSRNLSEAEAALLKALRFAQERLSASDRDLSQIHMALASHYSQRGLIDKAILHARTEIAAIEADEGPSSGNLSNGLARLSQLLAQTGNLDEAVDLQRRSCELVASNFSYAPVVSACWSNLADLLTRAGRWRDAYETVRMSASMQRTYELSALRSNDRDAKHFTTGREAPFAYTFLSQISKAWKIFPSVDRDGPRLIGETFEAGQWATRSRAGDALNRSTARLSVTTTGLGDLARRMEMLAPAKDAAEAALVTELNKVDRDSERIAALRVELSVEQREIDNLTFEMIQRFPSYAALSNPAPLSIEAVRSLLAPDEVLIMFLVMNRRDTGILGKHTFIWAITKTDARWVRSEFGAEELLERVTQLRCGLDRDGEWQWSNERGRWLGRKPACASMKPDGLMRNEPLPFDLVKSHELFQGLFGDLDKLIKDKHLLVVPSGALTSLPFQVFATAPSIGNDLAAASWLIRDHALTVLPSVASLAALRRNAKPSDAPDPFIGFGDPVLTRTCDPADIPDKCPEDEIKVVTTVSSTMRSAGEVKAAEDYFRNGLADVAALQSRLCPLPDTAHELRCVARSLGAETKNIVLGKDMTETAVKSLPLNRYRVVHFATHGLLAGQTAEFSKNRAEPALVFSPPAIASEKDDGLLTASEVADLQLDADWVVMSACNTASGAEPGAEALSGLAKAFFYAGARALLVSHWPVDSYAATMLTSRTFAEMKKQPSISRSEAVRQAMLALMNDKDRPWAGHPSVWAPFVVVGEGAAIR